MAKNIIATGIPELDRELALLEGKLQKKGIRQATRKSAKDVVLARARQEVPIREGTLHDTLVVRTARGLKRGEMGHMVTHVERKTTDDPWHAAFVAFGTEKWPLSAGSETGTRRYVQEALFGSARQVRSVFRTELRSGVNKIANEWRRKVK